MRKWSLFLLLLIGPMAGEEEDLAFELPKWDDEDLEALESGEWVPGSNILGRVAREFLDSDNQDPIEIIPEILDLPDDDEFEAEELSKEIEEQFLTSYFREAPVGYLNDPQHLLTTREFRDREGFLDFHANDTDIDLYLYLFDGVQEIPPGESIEKVLNSQLDGKRPAAVAFYFLGKPEKTQLVFTEPVVASVNGEERDKVLRMAVEEAMEKSDALSQLESFLIQSSIRLYWLEKVVAKGRGGASGYALSLSRRRDGKEAGSGIWSKLVERPEVFYPLVSFVIISLAIGIWVAGKWLRSRKRAYVFPDAAGSPLLDAPHAPGVGGVLSFSSATEPPSSQKSEVPDYLRQM